MLGHYLTFTVSYLPLPGFSIFFSFASPLMSQVLQEQQLTVPVPSFALTSLSSNPRQNPRYSDSEDGFPSIIILSVKYKKH